jgi:hypothetical protein
MQIIQSIDFIIHNPTFEDAANPDLIEIGVGVIYIHLIELLKIETFRNTKEADCLPRGCMNNIIEIINNHIYKELINYINLLILNRIMDPKYRHYLISCFSRCCNL